MRHALRGLIDKVKGGIRTPRRIVFSFAAEIQNAERFYWCLPFHIVQKRSRLFKTANHMHVKPSRTILCEGMRALECLAFMGALSCECPHINGLTNQL